MDTITSFVRQRRNLIAVSILLVIAQQTGITIDQINLLGNEFKLLSAYSVASLLWIPAIYWMIRYYQAVRDLGDLGFANKLSGVLNRTLLPRRAFQQYLRTADRPRDMSEASKATWDEPEVAHDLTGYRVKLKVHWHDAGRYTSASPDVFISHKEARWPVIRGWIYVLFHTSLFTEYALPPILFLIAVIQGVWLCAT
jgi:hypothetical protein